MRQQNTNNSNRRPRGRSNNNNNARKPQQSRNGVFDSNGPGGRIRGNASQLKDKYLQMARDATVSGDRVLAESLHQFAEHYFRVVNDSTDPLTEAQVQAQIQNQAQAQSQSESSSSSSSGQRNNQSDNYRHRNSRSGPEREEKVVEDPARVDNEVRSSETVSLKSESTNSESVKTDTQDRKPAPRSRMRSRRPRYEENTGPVDSPEIKAAPEVTPIEAKPVVAELPLGEEAAPLEKPKRKPRTPKPAAATGEVKTPRPRGRPRKTPVKTEEDNSSESA